MLGKDKVSLSYLDGAEHGDRRFTTPANLDGVIAFLDHNLK